MTGLLRSMPGLNMVLVKLCSVSVGVDCNPSFVLVFVAYFLSLNYGVADDCPCNRHMHIISSHSLAVLELRHVLCRLETGSRLCL